MRIGGKLRSEKEGNQMKKRVAGLLLALMMALCDRRFTATQYALLSAFASVGRVWVGPVAGVLAESIGWPTFFVVSTLVALPGLVVLVWQRGAVRNLSISTRCRRAWELTLAPFSQRTPSPPSRHMM